MTKKKIGTCLYCGKNKEVNREHIPSKNLFFEKEKVNFRFADSCYDCNEGFSKDEEFFRNWLVNANYEISDEATKLFNGPISRSYHYRPSLAKHFFNRMQVKDIFNPISQTLEKKTLILTTDEDKQKILRIVKKYAKGLCLWHFGSILDPQINIEVIQVDEHWLRKNSNDILKMPINIVKSNVFEYRYGQVLNSQQSLWVMRFYSGIYFAVFVTKLNLNNL